ncbi:MAG TPA: DNA-3-methyladenine glycosylase I [Candidatus Eremiobacteraceae bacterium]|nr:DNA-3-methyladenine glycosylase I [Candidatus Eremiobacteraceae bacterium]
MDRLWFIVLDTERLRSALSSAHARAARNALAPAATAAGVVVVDACVVPCGVRALILARRSGDIRAFARRYVVLAARGLEDVHVRWRVAMRVVLVPSLRIGAWRAFIARMRAAFVEVPNMSNQTPVKPSSTPGRAPRRKGTKATARAGASLVRAVDLVVDALLGGDECAARLRRYVADHDAPADDASAFGRLCEVIFAQGLGHAIVIRKRPALADAFEGFTPTTVASYGEADVRRLLGSPIIRNEAKIRACIENAQRWCDVAKSDGSYLARIARIAAADSPAEGWPSLTTAVAADFARINETAARQTLKRWGFFTAFGNPGSRRVIERLGLIDPAASVATGQLLVGSVADALLRDPYAVEGLLALFAALGPCNPEPRCDACSLSTRCPTGAQRHSS